MMEYDEHIMNLPCVSSMTPDRFIRQLRGISEQHQNDRVGTGDIRWTDLTRDCADMIEALLKRSDAWMQMYLDLSEKVNIQTYTLTYGGTGPVVAGTIYSTQPMDGTN